ncbi:alpha/beta hydrolase [Phaeovibrio sulfidiphilus]|uniref:Alpha/beta hydrolase n=1 Tax=Phaeovibrio sulfidiphilus TaxID=1220600 RepID=A0A8J7CPW7_9PROT|nr:alpha/beta hydrolase [Phaeovibrio sulfidiphilus]MBE1237547.1 alpha/beta hydrolase [Phaeovibrio sulfidiphilus]
MDQTSFQAPDSLKMPLRSWLPDGKPPEAIFLALHGFCDHSGAWDVFGPSLAARNIAVFSWDQRGFGHSPDRGQWPGHETLIADVRAALRAVHDRYPDTPLYLMGESMGASLAVAATTGPERSTVPIRGLILSGPALWARATMSWPMTAAMWVARKLLPGVRLSGRGVERYATNNVPLLQRLSKDPLWIHAPTVESIAGLTDVMDIAYARFAELEGPVLVLYGLNDEIVPAGPVRTSAAKLDLRTPSNRLAIYPEGWHMLTRDIGGAAVTADILSWVGNPDAPLPSGADRNAAAFLNGTLRSGMERKEREHPSRAWERLTQSERERLQSEQDSRPE